MSNASICELWNDAAGFDPTLSARPAHLAALKRKHVLARPYAREALFEAMARGEPAVFSGVHVPVAQAAELGLQAALVKAICGAFKPGERAGAQVGPSRSRRKLPVRELMRRWNSGHHLVSVTDLHIRGTRLERQINTDDLSAFNLLPLGSEDMRRQEMMTMVIGARGNVTDSHSDDPDGSNHCFTGRKLWLAWETFEGQQAGLQDCERGLVRERARFSLSAFCSLRSARWWTVGPGETLFLPGRLTHKVVTLEPYIGIGSFYVAPTSCLDSLSRWYLHGPLWSMDDPRGDNAALVDEIAVAMRARLRRLVRQSERSRRQWGLDFVQLALDTWQRAWPRGRREALMARPPFARLVNALRRASAPV